MIRLLVVLLFTGSLSAKEPAFILGSVEKQKFYRSFLPKTKDTSLKSIIDKPLTFYTEKEMPKVFQHGSAVFSSSNNISAARVPGSYPMQFFGGREPFGNANMEFPWLNPAGVSKNSNFNSIRFMFLPEGKKIEYWIEILPGDDKRPGDGIPYESVVWEFPLDTIFGEILLVTNKEGYSYTFEVRTRRKQSNGNWKVNVYRPFPTADDLVKSIDSLPKKMRKNEKVVDLRLLCSAKLGTTVVKERIKNDHPVEIFNELSSMEFLPEIPEDIVKRLLSNTNFKSSLGEEWKPNGGFAPSTKADFHIVPKQYRASHIAANSKSCMRCHDTVQKHADDFQPFLSPNIPRDWYGRVRGSDNIFSFHPFALESINYNEGSKAYPRKFRQEMEAILEERKKN